MNVYYIEDSSTKKEMLKEADSFTDDSDKSINHDIYGSLRTETPSNITSTMMSRNPEDRLRISESDHRSLNHTNRTIEYSEAFQEELDKRKIVPYVENHTADYTIARFQTTRNLENRARDDSTLIDALRSIIADVVRENPDKNVKNLSHSQEDHASSIEKAFSIDLKETFREGQRDGDKPANILTSTIMEEDNTTKNTAVESLAVLGKIVLNNLHCLDNV